MKDDGVNIAFSLILEEIESAVQELNNDGAQAFQKHDYLRAEHLIKVGTELQDFRTKVRILQEQWLKGFDEPIRERTRVERIVSSAHKGPRKGLRVTLPNGKIIQETIAAQTFLRVIEEIGIEKVKSLNLIVNNHPLISYQQSSQYNQHKLNGHLVMTHSSTDQKKRTLEDIAHKLNIRIKVDIVA